MRLYSTPESARAGEPSLLAIVETLLAMAASVWIGVHFGTWKHIAIGACIAPFLLLRTEESCQYAILRIERLIGWVVDTSRWPAAGAVALFFPLLFAGVRVWATIVQTSAHPVIALRAIPGNWRRSTIALDSSTSPEWMPLPTVFPEGLPELEWLRQVGQVYSMAQTMVRTNLSLERGEKRRTTVLDIGQNVIIGGLIFVPAAVTGLAYRWSIKSTAIIWAPMLWALMPPKPTDDPWLPHLKLKATSDFNRIVFIFSIIELTLIAAKYVLFLAEHKLALRAEAWRGWLGERLGEFVAAFVRPGEFPIWQLASTTNAVLAIIVFFLIRSWLRHAEVGLPAPDARIDRTLSVLYFFRRLLTSYAIVCNGIVAIQLARKLPMPTIGSKLFPWV